MKPHIHTITELAIFTAIAFIFSYIESLFPLPIPLTLIINVKSGEEWGMQYALTSVGKIFTRPVNNGVFTDWIQV